MPGRDHTRTKADGTLTERAQKSLNNKKLFKQVTERTNLEVGRLPKEMTRVRNPDPMTWDIIKKILIRISCGDTLRGAAHKENVAEATFRSKIMRGHPLPPDFNFEEPEHGGIPDKSEPTLLQQRVTLNDLYNRAKELQAEAWCDEIIQISDDATEDDVQVARLRIDTRRWLMGKNNIRFHDKATLTLEGGQEPIRVIGSEMSPREAAAEYAKTLKS